MADPVYGLTSTAAKQVGQVVREVLRTLPPTGRRTRRVIGGGGNNCTNIRFQILVADAVTRTALCVILSRPYGCGIASVPNTVSDGYAIEVCDPAGCFLNDPEEVLVGRDGWAHYMEPIPGSTWCQDGTYDLQPEWQVYSLCCQVDRCFL